MKKILFVTPHMICAGVEKALLNLIDKIPEEYEIHILFVKAQGDLLEDIPQKVKYAEINIPKDTSDILLRGGLKANIIYNLKNFEFFTAGKILFKRIFLKDMIAELNIRFNSIPDVENKYDIAVCYHLHMPFIVKYVADKVNASIKCAWIHNDFIETGYNVSSMKKTLRKYNHFFGVSEELIKQYINIFPDFSNKSSVFYNITPEERIKKLANIELENDLDFDFDDKKNIKLLTIGRLDPQKGYDLAIEVCHLLKSKEINFKWFILGEGKERTRIEKQIKRLGLENYFILCGLKNNPYPYLKNCDIYVQTSRHEGYCTTLNEARILGKPIVTTNVAGVKEMIDNGNNGFICDYNKDQICKAIEYLIKNKDIRENFSKELEKLDFNTENEIEKLLDILKG